MGHFQAGREQVGFGLKFSTIFGLGRVDPKTRPGKKPT